MIAIDTQSLLWWSQRHPRLSEALAARIDTGELLVPAIVCWEIAMLVAKGRIELRVAAAEFMRQALALPSVSLAPITPEIGELAARRSNDLPSDPADRLIAATAIVHGVPLVTSDRTLRSSSVETLWY